ncbi:hypothetical protein FV139_06150 [Parahaliea maris]|uniref:Uncharacterized protein n=1 Tax=Parahaliea maris TaxID=2716870 RepID=A0A5C9A7B5_9GAMM|nr:hypothetical protein [Parahaliea maris]TXS95467.1 hypothetical protein FV139_06150 [Parahaliea maris]
MEPLYNVYFAGEVLPGQDSATVRQRVQALFKADEQTLAKLFSGKAQLIKRECDKATAVKFKQALERAGAKPVIKRLPATDPAAGPESPPTAAQSAPADAPPMTMAERLAALTGDQAPAEPPSGPLSEPRAQPQPAAGAETEASTAQAEAGEGPFELSPPGSDVLRPQERAQPVHRDVDTSALSLAAAGERLSEEPPPPPAAPDTGHLSVAATGETIPNLPRDTDVPAPDTSAIDLAPEGSDFSDCAAPPAEPPELNLDDMEVAPAGSELLESQYRKEDPVNAPDTSHLSVDKP